MCSVVIARLRLVAAYSEPSRARRRESQDDGGGQRTIGQVFRTRGHARDGRRPTAGRWGKPRRRRAETPTRSGAAMGDHVFAGAGRMNAPNDLTALESRQDTARASGHFVIVGTMLQIVGQSLAQACDLRTVVPSDSLGVVAIRG